MNNYQDYVIKDGKFIGAFEEMYQNCENPWNQIGEVKHSWSRYDTVVSISKFGIKKVIEVGCGLGEFTDFLNKHCLELEKIVGIDTSKTAIEKAKKRYSNLKFEVNDITKLNIWGNEKEFIDVDGIIFSEILWFILEDLEDIFEQLREKYAGKYLIINQTFYKNGQKYGREFFTNQEEMIKYIPFKLVASTWGDDFSKNSLETHTVFVIKNKRD